MTNKENFKKFTRFVIFFFIFFFFIFFLFFFGGYINYFKASYIPFYILSIILYFLISMHFSKDLISVCVNLLSMFILGSAFLCFFGLFYFGLLYLLVYAGAISILFIFIVFLLNMDDDFSGNDLKSFFLVLFFSFFCTMLYSEYLYLNAIDFSVDSFELFFWNNEYKYLFYNYYDLGIGFKEVGLIIYTNYLHIIILVGFLLALCTVGPILIISGPFTGASSGVQPIFTQGIKFKKLSSTFSNVYYEDVFFFVFFSFLRSILFFVILIIIFYKILVFILGLLVANVFPFFQLIPIIFIVCILYFLLLYLSIFFGSIKSVSVMTKEQATPYECGFAPYESSRTRFEIHFFLVAILFLVFDIEVTYIFPYVLIQELVSLDSFLVLLAFLSILAFGLLYEWYSGVLFWSDEHSDTFRI